MKIKSILTSFLAIYFMVACVENKASHSESEHLKSNQLLTAKEQSKLTPDDVIGILKQGNDEFVNNRPMPRNTPERIKAAVNGQHPAAIILSCIDSRVPVEDVFHRGIGDVFVARVAGNIVNADILASMEYACKVSGSKLVVVLGHESCGALKSAIDDVKLGNISELLEKITPAVNSSKSGFQGDTSSSNKIFVEKVSHSNVALAMSEIRKKSPILKEMEDRGEIKIVGAMYHLQNGKVDFLEGR
ncbi:carbonic anhydrase family protein [Chryseobacterium koreense]|uniref:carbonic anhydrase family protein n=1 Tax=Chryseobacterium koreense TaxID=232216 RepID=UPI0026EA7712|nr:carbonic anhydrase family protein [Chryseobacterium koreense]